MPRAGFEPATTRSSASPSATRCDWVERSPRLSYLGIDMDSVRKRAFFEYKFFLLSNVRQYVTENIPFRLTLKGRRDLRDKA